MSAVVGCRQNVDSVSGRLGGPISPLNARFNN